MACLVSQPVTVFSGEYFYLDILSLSFFFKLFKQHVVYNEAAGGTLRVSPFSLGSWSLIRDEQHPCTSGVSVFVRRCTRKPLIFTGWRSGPVPEVTRALEVGFDSSFPDQ